MKLPRIELQKLIGREGREYTDHPSDLGGPTKFGITASTARENGYLGQLVSMTEEQAEKIYEEIYWIKPKFDLVADIDPSVAFEMFDTGVNMGQHYAGLFLQMALNALNRGAKDFADVTEDGRVGPQTLAALRAYKSVRGALGIITLLKALNHLQGARYIELSRTRQANEDFVYGWIAHRT